MSEIPARFILSLLAGTVLAATGQVLFKIGAAGRETITSFLNAWIFAGLASYALGTMLWIYALSKIRLTVVYPFTALTFVLVYLFGILILREPAASQALVGVALILAGLFLISIA
jgi:undecaprenyl phosphate-alpha-L-ara4N flippase subunit ArnE